MNSVISNNSINTHANNESRSEIYHALFKALNMHPISKPWIFKADEVFPPEGSTDHPGIRYQKLDEKHIFVVDPEHVTSPLIFITFLSQAEVQQASYTSTPVMLTVEKGSVTFIEYFFHVMPQVQVSLSEHYNTRTEIILQKQACLSHLQIQQGISSSQQLSTTKVLQKGDSQYQGTVLSFNMKLQQTIFHLHLQAEFARAKFRAMMDLKRQQKTEFCLIAHHEQPNCQSDMMVRGVAADQAKGDFLGKIIVSKDASLSKAQLENKNLLLSEQAELSSRPQLEIYNDNVQCTHGATVGHLDAEALFYLKSRGIAEHEARKMLISVFVKPILENVPDFLYPYLEACISE